MMIFLGTATVVAPNVVLSAASGIVQKMEALNFDEGYRMDTHPEVLLGGGSSEERDDPTGELATPYQRLEGYRYFWNKPGQDSVELRKVLAFTGSDGYHARLTKSCRDKSLNAHARALAANVLVAFAYEQFVTTASSMAASYVKGESARWDLVDSTLTRHVIGYTKHMNGCEADECASMLKTPSLEVGMSVYDKRSGILAAYDTGGTYVGYGTYVGHPDNSMQGAPVVVNRGSDYVAGILVEGSEPRSGYVNNPPAYKVLPVADEIDAPYSTGIHDFF